MIEKKDYEAALKQFENLSVNAQVNILCYDAAIEMLKKKISEFPVAEKDKDEMPADLKEKLQEITK